MPGVKEREFPIKRKTRSDKGKKRNMKKVSKKGAYKKNVKDQMVKRRAPMVETKQRVHSDIATLNGYAAGADNLVNPLNWRTLVVDDAFTNVPLRSWTRNSHGFNDYNCIGNSIFSKYLNVKAQFRFPRGEDIELPNAEGGKYSVPNRVIQQPTKLYMICGWITESLNYPLKSTPSPSLPAQADATQEALDAYIAQQLQPYFDDDEDKLQFRPKSTTNIKIDKYVRIKPALDTAIGSQVVPIVPHTAAGPSEATAAHGSIPDVHRSWSVQTNRKLPLTEGTETSFPVDKQNLFCNNSWVPFCVIYNPDYEAQAAKALVDPGTGLFTQVQLIEYRWNDAHYFTDS